MRRLEIYIEKMGEKCLVGHIVEEEPGRGIFQYASSWFADPASAAISVSLPLQEEPFSAEATKNYFDGLLPEGFTRQSVASWAHVHDADYLSILSVLGEECLGAVQVLEEGRISGASGYEKLTAGQVRALAREGASRSTQIVTKTHLSLAGASGKVGLYYEEKSGAWYLPLGDAPSTHIVKQSHVRLGDIVVNEQLCLLTARNLGLDVPESFIVNTGDGQDEDILFATRRYDRGFTSSYTVKTSGLPIPLRLHQEDFAQAMGISSSRKYETPGDEYLSRMFSLLREVSVDPIADQMKLWDILIFDWLIGNTDGHIKNFSLLYDPNLRGIRLAPAYDIVSTIIYPSGTEHMSVSIGGEFNIRKIDRSCFIKAASQAGIGARMALDRLDALTAQFPKALAQSAEQLTAEGFLKPGEMQKIIMGHYNSLAS